MAVVFLGGAKWTYTDRAANVMPRSEAEEHVGSSSYEDVRLVGFQLDIEAREHIANAGLAVLTQTTRKGCMIKS